VRFHADFDLRFQQAHFAVDEAGKTLHSIEDGLNLKLNRWSRLSTRLFLSSQTKALCANNSETGTPWIITVGRRRKAHFGGPIEYSSTWSFLRGVGRFGA
jgi:hypothetical protein